MVGKLNHNLYISFPYLYSFSSLSYVTKYSLVLKVMFLNNSNDKSSLVAQCQIIHLPMGSIPIQEDENTVE